MSTSDGDTALTVQKFFDTLYGKCDEGFLGIWNVQDKNTQWVRVSELDDAISISNILAKSKDVYFGIGLQNKDHGSKTRGKVEDVVCIPGVWAEVDYSSGDAHSESKLPPDRGAARSLITEMPLAPTILVHSGNGFHAYWAFTKPLYFSNEEERKLGIELVKNWQRILKDLALEYKWRVDSTFDLVRVYRVPGTLNRKSDPPKPVTIDLLNVTATYPVEKFEEKISIHKASKEEDKGDQPKKKRGRKPKEETLADAEMAASSCAFLKHCKDNPTSLTEPEWRGMMTIVGRCQDGERLVHEWSKPHPGYDERETTKKLEHAMRGPGPLSCQYIHDNLNAEEMCGECPFFGRIKSPIVLGKDQAGDVASQYVYAIQLKRFINIESKIKYDKEQLTDVYSALTDKMAAKLLASPSLKQVEQPTYWPGKDLFVMDEGRSCINMWTDDGVAPAPGDSSVFQNHLEYVIPDEKERNHVLDFFSFILQRPGEKIKHAIVIQGEQGIGKSYFLELFVRLVGQNAREINTEMLRADYNGWMEGTQVVVIEELMGIGRRELVNKLKPLITSPRCPINEKFVASYVIPNRVNFLAFTNHEDALLLDEDDRRFFMYHSPAVRREGSYYNGLFSDLDVNASAIKYYLLNRDISAFRPDEPAPMTEAKRDVIEASRSPLEAWIMDRHAAGVAPLDIDVVSVQEIMDTLDPSKFKNVTPHMIGKVLKKVGCKQLGLVTRDDRTKVMAWSRFKHELYLEAKNSGRDPIALAKQQAAKKEPF